MKTVSGKEGERQLFSIETLRLVAIAAFSIFTLNGAAAESLDTTTDEIVSNGAGAIDYENAQPVPLPAVAWLPEMDGVVSSGSMGKSGAVSGKLGSGKQAPVTLVPKSRLGKTATLWESSIVTPSEYGTANHPYTTSRIDLTDTGTVSALYPNSATGKLFARDGFVTYSCSAALIGNGLVVTAAHCVSEFGTGRYFTDIRFAPAYFDGVAPFGVWDGAKAVVKSSYLQGTDVCASFARGVVCKNDIAIVTLKPLKGKYPGEKAGYYGYAWGGYGFVDTETKGPIAQLHQIGFSADHDRNNRLQRTDAQGEVSDSVMANNTVWGSRLSSGSSGGPLLINYGVAAKLSGTGYGFDADYNQVVGVTSWGYTATGVKMQGSSPFLSTNIEALVKRACRDDAAACQL